MMATKSSQGWSLGLQKYSRNEMAMRFVPTSDAIAIEPGGVKSAVMSGVVKPPPSGRDVSHLANRPAVDRRLVAPPHEQLAAAVLVRRVEALESDRVEPPIEEDGAAPRCPVPEHGAEIAPAVGEYERDLVVERIASELDPVRGQRRVHGDLGLRRPAGARTAACLRVRGGVAVDDDHAVCLRFVLDVERAPRRLRHRLREPELPLDVSRSNTSRREPLLPVLTIPTNDPSGVSFGTTQRTSAPPTLGPASSGDHILPRPATAGSPTAPVALP